MSRQYVTAYDPYADLSHTDAPIYEGLVGDAPAHLIAGEYPATADFADGTFAPATLVVTEGGKARMELTPEYVEGLNAFAAKVNSADHTVEEERGLESIYEDIEDHTVEVAAMIPGSEVIREDGYVIIRLGSGPRMGEHRALVTLPMEGDPEGYVGSWRCSWPEFGESLYSSDLRYGDDPANVAAWLVRTANERGLSISTGAAASAPDEAP